MKPTPETAAAGAAGAAVGAPGLGLAAGAAQQGGKGMSAPAQQGRGSRAAGAFQGVSDGADSAAQQLQDPENAMTAVDTLDGAAQALEDVANAFDRIGSGIIDSVYFDAGVAQYFEQLGQYVRQAVDPTREGADQIRKVHAEDIERIDENDPKKRKWDIQAHD